MSKWITVAEQCYDDDNFEVSVWQAPTGLYALEERYCESDDNTPFSVTLTFHPTEGKAETKLSLGFGEDDEQAYLEVCKVINGNPETVEWEDLVETYEPVAVFL